MTGILLDEKTGDILIEDGVAAVGDNTQQCVEEILRSSRGEYKEYPMVGGECYKLLHGSSSRFWANRVRVMCLAMGIPIKRIENNNQGNISIVI